MDIEIIERLENILIEKDYTKITPNDDILNTNSYLTFKCKNGHSHTTKIKNILYSNTGCKECQYDKKRDVLLKKTLDPIANKICNYCNEEKTKSCFGKDKNKRDGLRQTCKECRRKIDTNKTSEQKQVIKNKSHTYLKNNPFRYLVSRSKTNHKKKGFVDRFEITEEYLKSLYLHQNGRCFWSDLNLDINTVGRGKLDTISIDRLDCSKGYVIGNVVITTKFFNLGRGNTSVDQFISFLKLYEMVNVDFIYEKMNKIKELN